MLTWSWLQSSATGGVVQALKPFVDDDGIVCLAAVRGEKPLTNVLVAVKRLRRSPDHTV
jgi:hypothetical protein